MSRMAMREREAFSLLEVIIATAILAGSAMVLFSLLSLGTTYGNRAEERTIAVSQAQSVLDEFIARMPSEEIREEVNGVLPSTPLRSFRIEVTPFELGGRIGENRSRSVTMETQTLLYRVKVELFTANASLASVDSEPLCKLSRLVRRPQSESPAADGDSGESSRPPAKKNGTNRKAGRGP